MIIFRDGTKPEIDSRKTVYIYNYLSFAVAVQINEDGTYDRVSYMQDDSRTYNNEAIIDASEKQILQYRKQIKDFQKGDKVKVVKGRKLLNTINTIKDFFTFRPQGTYGQCDIEYLIFENGIKLNKKNCELYIES